MQRLFGSSSKLKSYLKECLYTVQIGSNDYLNNYFMPTIYMTSTQYSPQAFATALNEDLSRQLKVSLSIFTLILLLIKLNRSLSKKNYTTYVYCP